MNTRGSSPIETVALLAILLVPIGPVLMLFAHLSDAMAAESIARHALRSGILEAEGVSDIPGAIESSVGQLSAGWDKDAQHRFSCGACEPGGLAALEVVVGSAAALQAAGLEPN